MDNTDQMIRIRHAQLEMTGELDMPENINQACEYGVRWADSHKMQNPHARHFYDIVKAYFDCIDNGISPEQYETEIRNIISRTEKVLSKRVIQ